MKKFSFFILVLFILSCSSTTTVIPERLDPIHIENAKQFAFSQFNSCATGNYIPITTKVATPGLVRNLVLEEMKLSCTKINKDYGKLLSLKIDQTRIYKKTLIYRFKATYSKIEHTPEIRVYSTLKHKYSGLIIKPEYLEKYTPFKPETKI